MITGQPGPSGARGISNCTYIWPIVICCGVRGRRRLAGRRAGYRGVFADLRDAADEEAALVLDSDRAAHEALRRLPVARQRRGRYEDSRGERDAWHASKTSCSEGLNAAQHAMTGPVPETPRRVASRTPMPAERRG